MAAPTDQLHIERAAPVERVELRPSSWVDVVVGFVRDATTIFDELQGALRWQQTEVLRYERYVPEQRLGTGVRDDAHPLLLQTGMHLRSRYRVPFTGVAAILYRDGHDFQ